MIDAVEHRQDLEASLKQKYGDDVVFDRKYGKKAEPKLDASSPFGIFKFWGELLGASKPAESKKPAVGIVYVDGPIVLGGGRASMFQESAAVSSKIRKALDNAASDDSIKAVVLRVNSPGGSALASEIILDATRRVKAKKPFIVSMGDVAGSGGYYVACGADTIFADDATITGSIGVVGGKLATGGMYDKLGVTFKSYRRGQNAGMLASGETFTPGERLKMRTWMDEIYGVFKGHVTAIRGNRLKKPIDDLAGGRVYTGKQALELGLVDRLGTLHDAIAFVAEQAKLTDYDVRVVPKPKSFLEQLLEDGADNEPRKGLDVVHRPTLLDLAQPFLRSLDPSRAGAGPHGPRPARADPPRGRRPDDAGAGFGAVIRVRARFAFSPLRGEGARRADEGQPHPSDSRRSASCGTRCPRTQSASEGRAGVSNTQAEEAHRPSMPVASSAFPSLALRARGLFVGRQVWEHGRYSFGVSATRSKDAMGRMTISEYACLAGGQHGR